MLIELSDQLVNMQLLISQRPACAWLVFLLTETHLNFFDLWGKSTHNSEILIYSCYLPCDIFLQYLESVQPLLNDKDYQEMERLVEDFKV